MAYFGFAATIMDVTVAILYEEWKDETCMECLSSKNGEENDDSINFEKCIYGLM